MEVMEQEEGTGTCAGGPCTIIPDSVQNLELLQCTGELKNNPREDLAGESGGECRALEGVDHWGELADDVQSNWSRFSSEVGDESSV